MALGSGRMSIRKMAAAQVVGEHGIDFPNGSNRDVGWAKGGQLM